MLCGISNLFRLLFPSERQVTHALLTRPPLGYPKASSQITPFDLHVLGTPPAFVLSQDQTLNKKFNLLLKLLWVFIRLKRIAGFILTIFCSIFKDHFILSPSSDFLILSLIFFSVNNFFLKTFKLFSSFLSDLVVPCRNDIYNIMILNTIYL